MRRSTTIAIILILILAIAGSAYAFVAKDREWWPFSSTAVVSLNTSGFTDIAPRDTTIYGYLDLANKSVTNTVANNPELQKNINTLKTGLQQMLDYTIESQTSMMMMDNEAQALQEIKTIANQAFTLLGNKKIHIALEMNASAAASMSADIPGDIIIGIESENAEATNESLVTLKSLLNGRGTTPIQSKDLQVQGVTVTEFSNTPTTSSEFTETMTPSSVPAATNHTYLAKISDRLLIMTTKLPAMEKVVQKSLQPSTDNLKNNAQFASLTTKITGPQLAVVYMDGQRYMQVFEAGLDPNSATDQATKAMYQALANSPIYQSHTLATATINDKGLYSDQYVLFNSPEVAANFANVKLTFGNHLPEDTFVFAEGNGLAQQMSMIALPILQSISALPEMNAAENPLAMLREFEQTSGLSIENDIVPLFSKNTAFGLHKLDSIVMPVALTILTQADDLRKAEATMDKVVNLVAKEINLMAGVPLPPATTSTENGVTIHSFGDIQGIETVFNYATIPSLQSLIISTAKSGISTIPQVGAQPSRSLAQATKYPAILKNSPDKNSVTYIDIKGLVENFMPLARLGMGPEEAQMYDTQIKPYLEIFNNIASYSLQEGNMVRSISQIQLVK